MKKIVDGTLYDTEAAGVTAVHTYEADCSRNDFNWFTETLYRTRLDNWFLYGRGNAMSPYSRSLDQNSRGGGEDLRPLTDEEAARWLERRAPDNVELYETFFELKEA